ncbi:MAG: hypothetical protein Q9M94_05125 [Candidatus Gracilibacteria bacterium]|nr:hypothetical protein [Candidatus Gracilibacteria bacterium]
MKKIENNLDNYLMKLIYAISQNMTTGSGVRPLKRVIINKIMNSLSIKLLNGDIKEGDSVVLNFGENGKMRVNKKTS